MPETIDSCLEQLSESKTPIAMFYAHRRTTFADTLRLARRLKRHGQYLPVFLLAAGAGESLQEERQRCLDAGILCFSEEEVLGFDAARAGREFEVARSAREQAAGNSPGSSECRLKDQIAAIASRFFAKWAVLVGKMRYGASIRADRRVLPPEGATIVIEWSSTSRVDTCEVLLTDYARDQYKAWIGKSGASPILVLHDTTFVLKCYDRNGKVLPGPPALVVRVQTAPISADNRWSESSPGVRRKGLGGRGDFRRMPWFAWFESSQKAKLNYLRVLRTIDPAVVCLDEDVPDSLSPALIRAAKMRRIPTFVVPFAIPSALEVTEHQAKDPQRVVRSPRHDELVAEYPHWMTNHLGTRVLRSSPDVIVASELAGMAPPQPFIPESGHADKILVESDRMLRVYREYDLPADQLVLTGSAADDFLTEAADEKSDRREALYRRLMLAPGRPMLLTELVSDQFERDIPFCEFENYAELVEFWGGTLAGYADRCNVILKVGAQDCPEDFPYLEKYRIAIVPDDIVDLVPLADIYVASRSPALRWAIASGVPSVNFDVYRYRSDYFRERGVVHVETRKEFVETLERLVTNEEHRARVARLQSYGSFRWGRLDGNSTQRIVRTFDLVRAEVASRPGKALRPRRSRGKSRDKSPRTEPVLFAVQSTTQLNELVRAAKVVEASGRFRAVFWLDARQPDTIDEMGDRCGANKLETLLGPPADDVTADWSFAAIRRSFRGWLFGHFVRRMFASSIGGGISRRALGWKGPINDIYEEEDHLRLVWWDELRRSKTVSSILSSLKPRLVVVGEDGVGGNAALVAIARERAIPTLVVPYEYSQRRQILMGVAGRFPFRPNATFDSLVARRFPKWITRGEDGALVFRIRPVIALVREVLKQSVENPWTVHGGAAEKVAVESELMRQHYLSEGLPDRKLHLTGALAGDDMHRTILLDPLSEAAFQSGEKRVKGKTSILCAIPPDYLGYYGVRSEFASFREIVDFWIDIVTSLPGAEVTVQLHPRMSKDDAEYVSSRVSVTDENIASLIPRCDFLVTSVSSIIRLAISCRKPVVNYDVYNFDYADYVDAPGVLNVNTREEFQKRVRELTLDDAIYTARVRERVDRRSEWGVIDGQAGARFLNLVDALVAH